MVRLGFLILLVASFSNLLMGGTAMGLLYSFSTALLPSFAFPLTTLVPSQKPPSNNPHSVGVLPPVCDSPGECGLCFGRGTKQKSRTKPLLGGCTCLQPVPCGTQPARSTHTWLEEALAILVNSRAALPRSKK